MEKQNKEDGREGPAAGAAKKAGRENSVGADNWGAAHWADETALRILREKGDKPCYTCASGITPSGTV
ncbi:MAG: hypothetical protein LBQ38_04775, partial [Spirochaetaceae bacterium]|nr:hypothetical protein [Spirochaetaceae bacterium]